MKAILYSFMVIALVGGMVGSGLFAYFSDTETSTGNTFEAGTIDISLTQDDTKVYQVINDVKIYDFKPCETGYLVFTIKNEGRNPVDVWKHIIRAEGAEDPNPTEPELLEENGTPRAISADDLWFDLTVNDVVLIPDGRVSLSDVISLFIPLGQLQPGESMTVTQSFHIKAEVTNYAQGDILTFDEEYVGQQVTNPTPPGQEFPLP